MSWCITWLRNYINNQTEKFIKIRELKKTQTHKCALVPKFCNESLQILKPYPYKIRNITTLENQNPIWKIASSKESETHINSIKLDINIVFKHICYSTYKIDLGKTIRPPSYVFSTSKMRIVMGDEGSRRRCVGVLESLLALSVVVFKPDWAHWVGP